MQSPTSRCPGCRAELEAGALPYRGYYNSSAECWAEYTQVLGREYQDPALFAQVHQLTVDAYAVQHAGGPQPDKSVCVHLVGLYLTLVAKVALSEVPAQLQLLAEAIRDWPHFEPPPAPTRLGAKQIARAPTSKEHAQLARAWAEDVWAAWSRHHAAVAELAERRFHAHSGPR